MQNLDTLTQSMVAGISGLMMGGKKVQGDQGGDVGFCSFNQDSTSLAVGTANGYKLYSLNSSDTLEEVYRNETEEVYIAERLFSSSLVAIVSHSDPRKLRVCHFKKATEICNFSYTSRILSVKMNRARLLVCLEESLFLHNIRDMTVLHNISDTPPNKLGLCALSAESAERCFLAYPGHSTVGELQIFDATNLSSQRSIPAHSSPLAAIAFSPSGYKVATASEKGTVIRVFCAADGTKLYELRRGLKRTANIYSLSFSPCGRFLACSSNTETIHVFRFEERQGERSLGSSPPSGGGDGWVGYLVSASASYLPSQVTETLLQERAFATVRQSQPGMKNVCAMALIKKALRLLVASSDGYLYLYALNLEDGGDCTLIKQFELNGNDDETQAAERKNAQGNGNSPSNDVGADASYADRVKNRQTSDMTDSEKFHEMEAATESPLQQCFLLDDDGEFPPMIPSVQ